MKKIIYALLVGILLTSASFAFASKNNFQFQISNYHTERQSGQTLNVYVRYAIKDGVDSSQFPDYRELRAIAMKYLEPTANLPAGTYWEIIAEKMADDLMSHYSFLSGVSIQLLVYPNEKKDAYEPGFHGPIYTIGDVIAFNQAVMPLDISERSQK